MSRRRLLVRAGIRAVLAGLFWLAFQDRYLARIDCFNAEGRCYDPATREVFTTGGAVWGLAAGICAVLAAVALLRAALVRAP